MGVPLSSTATMVTSGVLSRGIGSQSGKDFVLRTVGDHAAAVDHDQTVDKRQERPAMGDQ